MAEISFYQLLTTPIEGALPKLVERVLGSGLRAVVVSDGEERVEHFNGLLWTYSPASFLPHGSAKDGNAADQPVFLSSRVENPNGARVLIATDGVPLEAADGFDRCLDLFDGRDEDALFAARDRWKRAKAAGHKVRYFRQTERGWEEPGAAA